MTLMTFWTLLHIRELWRLRTPCGESVKLESLSAARFLFSTCVPQGA